MDVKLIYMIEKASLLYDVGKIVARANNRVGDVIRLGADFLRPYFYDDDKIINTLLGCGENAVLQDDDLSYILNIADKIAAGADSRNNQKAIIKTSTGRNLESIFNIFASSMKDKDDLGFVGNILTDCTDMVFPASIEGISVQNGDYEKILKVMKERFDVKSPNFMSTNEILNLLENIASNIPYTESSYEPADVSLYDHAKLMTAFAVCLYQYFEEHEVANYRKFLNEGQDDLKNQEVFLLVSGDISGIQQFIYTIPSKGALKSLRGRSFYLEILLENIIDEILTSNNINRECLLYSGGGHFYMILPNTEKVRSFLDRLDDELNDWFLNNFGKRLYIAMGYTACKPSEFMANDELAEGVGAVYRRVTGHISDKKIKRYNKSQLADLFNPESNYNKNKSGNRECGICHTSVVDVSPYQVGSDTMACPTCRALFRLGEKILLDDICVVDENNTEDAIPVPAIGRKLYLHTSKDGEGNDTTSVRRYVKNQLYVRQSNDVRIWFGDYVVRNKKNHVLEFEELARRSGGSDEEKGIPRLGILRADVDNLGAAFMAGIPRHYATLSRTATLSRQLSIFFKRYINAICAGNVNGVNETGNKKFSLFDINKSQNRNVHIVYSGGDDLFLVGSWDDLIELAVDIRRKFATFTNNKLTFSAGLALFQDKAPVAFMAKSAGKLEDFAKGNEGKNSIALFGASNEVKNADFKASAQVYSWHRFTDSVCGTKLQFIKDNFEFNNNVHNSEKLVIGKSAIYRMLSFFEDEKDSDAINMARFAYVLARLSPDEKSASKKAYEKIRQQFYEWYKNKEDRKELYTAFTFVVYSLREKEEKK